MPDASTSFRRPLPPKFVERFDIAHPALPEALDGLTILHVSDLHVRRHMLATERYRTIFHALEQTPADVIAITGDIMDEPGHERAGLDTLRAMAERWQARVGVLCVFGNHDTPEFRRAAQRELTQINYVGGRTIDLNLAGAILRVVGLDWPEDPLSVMLNAPPFPETRDPRPETRFSLALAHHPTSIVGVAELGIPLMIAGHTHAGQVRVHTRFSPHTSSDLPAHLATGVLRLKDTLCCISRGLGDGVVEHLRINCPRQMPLYTLRRGEMGNVGVSDALTQVLAW